MMKEKTKTIKALRQAAGRLRKISEIYYTHSQPGQMLKSIRRAEMVVGRLEKNGVIPNNFARRKPINGVSYQEGLEKVSYFCDIGEPFIAISYALSVAERSIMNTANVKGDFASAFSLKGMLACGTAITSAARKLEDIAFDKSREGDRVMYGFLGC